MRRLVILVIVGGGCGCTTVGPDYQRPQNAVITAKTATGSFVGADDESFVTEPPPGAWWELYRDATLNGLIKKALAVNTALRVASATISRAEASLDLAKDKRLPSTSLEASPSYTRLSPQEQLLPEVNIPPL